MEIGTGNSCTLLLTSWTIPAYLETFPAQAAFKMFNGFCVASRIRAWLSGREIVTSNRSVLPVPPRARISGLSLCLPRGLSSTIGCRAALARSPAKSRTCASCLLIYSLRASFTIMLLYLGNLPLRNLCE